MCGEVQGAVSLEPADRTQLVCITVDGLAVRVEAGRITLNSSTLPDGEPQIRVLARDTSRRPGQLDLEFRLRQLTAESVYEFDTT